MEGTVMSTHPLQIDLSGRRVLITGSATGIGRAIASAMAAAGAQLVVHGLPSQAEVSAQVAQSIGAVGVELADFSDSAAPDQLADAVERRWGGVDVLVLCAAIDVNRPWAEIERQEAERMLGINLLAPLRLTQRLAPAMVDHGWGRVLMIGSVQQERPHPQKLVYGGAKAAMEHIARNLAKQLAGSGVTVNTLAPGAIETDLNRAVLADPQYRETVLSRIPAKRIGTPADCAGAALFLCSDAASYITGVSLLVDGGMAL
ncbi:MAG: SDR family oxidoreductase [Comamonadaceae bacterium]|nr:MAG: SDR family oxidoreductase [Comamonadaceae bacterium]